MLCSGAPTRQADAQPLQPRQPASRPAPSGARPFQRGVSIDWAQRAVYVDGHVVLRAGPIEFLACFPGKEHESIIGLDASATHVYLALGLIGLEPGHPPQWDDRRGRFGPPAGDLIDVALEWEDEDRRQTAPGFEWLREFEFARPPIDRPWVFAGSRRLQGGMLAADHNGEGIAVVDKPHSLLALSRNHVSHDAELWAHAATVEIPPLHTPVRVVLRPAEARAYEIRVDFLGEAFVNGRYAHAEDAADLIKLARRLSPDYVQRIRLEGTLRADVARLKEVFARAGVPAEALHFVRGESTTAPGVRDAP
jgi:hypothetical protein